MQHFIGITDFTSADEVQRILRVPVDRVLDTKMDHVLGVGVMMSYKTLRGLPTKWSKAFPPNEKIAEIFTDWEDVFNVLHYADYDGVTKAEDIRDAIAFGGPHLDALQLDMIWPDVEIIGKGIELSGKRPKIILQVGENAMKEVGDAPTAIADRLYEWHAAGCADYVLFDKSMGQGKEMDAEFLLNCYYAARELLDKDELGVVVAGGLGPFTMHLLEPFRHESVYNDISIDAQGQLRRSKSALDPIDWHLAEEYFGQACGFFGFL